MTGTLVRYCHKQFGIIVMDDEKAETCWCHWTKLPEGSQEGDYLEFKIGNGLKGNFAYEVRKIQKKESPKARKAAKSKVR